MDSLFENASYRAKPLKYSTAELSPVFTKQNVEYHYEVHTKNYAKQANKQADPFNVAGIELHNIWWSTLAPPQANNVPTGEVLDVIIKKHKGFEEFKTIWKDTALDLQGSGWIAMMYTGRVLTIKNHSRLDGIVMLLDMWEHSYYPTYGPDKQKYIESMWKIYNWKQINKRVITFQKDNI